MRTHTPRLVVTLAVLSVVCSACSGVIAGVAEPAGSPSGGAKDSQRTIALGDVRTLDVCGLTPGEALGAVGRVENRASSSGVNSCQRTINIEEDAGGGQKRTLGVLDYTLTLKSPIEEVKWLKTSYPTEFSEGKQGATTTYKGKSADGGCMRTANADKGQLQVVVKKRRTETQGDACATADAAFDAVLASVLSDTPIPRRPTVAGSIANLDPCALVTPEMVRASYTKELQTSPQISVFSCAFGGPGRGMLTVNVGHMIVPGRLPAFPGTKVTTIAGRPATETLSGPLCVVDLGHVMTDPPADATLPYLESVHFSYMTQADDAATACEQTTKLATAVAEKLPPIS
ncbi:hypothetical protein GCM10022247_07120 [Allokutzneria multivorans]|uniref:DUF3558 domain-containing protein n=1 Tax=Allokutzneria multivorans TaxID=1142134 RepID=A0ABP7R2Y0_9PSEU